MKTMKQYGLAAFLALFLPAMIFSILGGGLEQGARAMDPSNPDQDLMASMAWLSEQQRDVLHQFPRIDSLILDTNGVPAYLFGDLGQIGSATPESALTFLYNLRTLLNSEGNHGYEYISTEHDSIGQVHIRFQQQINGLPVVGAVIIVHLEIATGRVVGLNGHIATGEAESTARLSASAALSRANAELCLREQGRMPQPLDEPTLAYVLTEEGTARLAWKAKFRINWELGAEDHAVYADAASGELLLSEKSRFDLLYREVYDFNRQNWKFEPLKLSILILREGGSQSNIAQEAKNVYPNLKWVYDYFKNRLNRNSFDNRDSKMIAVVHANNTSAAAFWDCGTQAAYFMDADASHDTPTKSLDCAAHEYGHGLNYSTATLGKSRESIMLSEGFSDILGACVEAYSKSYSGGGNPSDETYFRVWSIGEDFWTPANWRVPLRSLRDPKSCDCSGFKYVDYYPNMGSAGSYEGSSVASLAFYLLAEGGMHPRVQNNVQVYGLGIPKAEQVFFRALSAYLTPYSDYGDLRQSTHQAARDLYGSKSLEQAQVWYCWQAVGVPAAATPSFREITNGQTVDATLDRPGWQYFAIRVPSGQGKLEITGSGRSGDADLYVRRAFAPTTSIYDRVSTGDGVTKTLRINNPQEGLWYIAVYVRKPLGFDSLVARYSASSDNVKLYEKETNNTIGRANKVIAANTTVVGRLYKYPPTSNTPNFVDQDFFQISIPAGKTVFVTMASPNGYDYKTSILDANGNVLVEEAITLGGYCGKFMAIDYNNNTSSTMIIYARVSAGIWKGGGGQVIENQVDPNRDYNLNITW